jgi:hypothetical protein
VRERGLIYLSPAYVLLLTTRMNKLWELTWKLKWNGFDMTVVLEARLMRFRSGDGNTNTLVVPKKTTREQAAALKEAAQTGTPFCAS